MTDRTTRRGLLRSLSASALAAPLLAQERPSGAASMYGVKFDARPKVRIGLVGVGGRGSALLQNFAAVDNVEIKEATRWQYVTGVQDQTLIDPESWSHDYSLLSRPGNDAVQLALFRDYATNPPLYPRLHEYFRAGRVPLLAVWGRGDEIFGPAGAEAFAEDLPDADIHLLDGGHFLLEFALDEVTTLIRSFLARQLQGV